MWAVFAIAFALVILMEEVFLVACLANLTSSRVQTFAESVRLSMNRLGALVSLLTAAFLYEWITIVGCVYIGIVLIITICLCMRRNVLKNPSIIIL